MCAGRAGWDGAAGPAVRGRPVDIAHRHAVPRIEEARWTPVGPKPAGRKSFCAGQMVLSIGDGPADRAHVLGPLGGVEGFGPPLIGAQRRALFLCRFRFALDGDVGVVVGDPGAERDQVVLGGRLGLVELPSPALADGARDQEEPKHGRHQNNTDRDQGITQHVRRRADRGRPVMPITAGPAVWVRRGFVRVRGTQPPNGVASRPGWSARKRPQNSQYASCGDTRATACFNDGIAV